MAKKLPQTAIIEVFPPQDTMKRSGYRMQEQDLLTKHWGLVKQSVVLSHVIDPLIEKRIISVDQWMDLKNRRMTEPERMEELLYILLKSKHDAVHVFLKVLQTKGYKHIADELEGKIKSATPTTYIGITDKRGAITRFKQVSVVKDDNDHADAFNNHSTSTSASTTNDSVRQTDLEKMKNEIKGELRQLRENLEVERKEDREQLKLIQRQHTDLQSNLDNIKVEREALKKKIVDLTNNVDQMKANLALKEKDYADLKRKNNFLLEELGKKSDAVNKAVQEKEKEKCSIEKKLESRNKEYKELQETLENIKDDHEERLKRLKAMNREKIRLEQNMKTSDKEKKDLEQQIKALEGKITHQQEEHEREIIQIQHDLDDQIDLISQLEKDKENLERILKETEGNNEELREQNATLQEKLQNSEEENAIMKARLQAVDIKKYAVPPYNTVVRGKNYRSPAQRSSWALFDKK